jgi:hypothetical protein
MPRRHYGIELTKSQAERHFDKVVWKTFKTRVHVLWSGPFHVCIFCYLFLCWRVIRSTAFFAFSTRRSASSAACRA